MLIIYYVVVFVVCGGARAITEDEAKEYLQFYGYMLSFEPAEFQEALKRFQVFANLPVSGQLDTRTQTQMSKPRCGLKDPQIVIQNGRRESYTILGSKWDKPLITWRLDNPGRNINIVYARAIIARAFKHWSDATNLKFKKVSAESNADIVLSFQQGEHGHLTFNVPGGVLAHAFPPSSGLDLSGDVHFNYDQDFSISPSTGVYFYYAVSHQIGHSLGLGHSNIPFANMYPWNTSDNRKLSLSSHDTRGIKSIYGKRNTSPTSKTTKRTVSTTRTTTTTTPIPTTTTTTTTRAPFQYRHCPEGYITSVHAVSSHTFIYTRKGMYVHLPSGKLEGPHKLSKYYPHIKRDIDSAFNYKRDDKTYTVLFAGAFYYVYEGFTRRTIQESIYGEGFGDNLLNLNFPRDVPQIDAAMTWHGNGKTYLFYKNWYWRYDTHFLRLDPGYPKKIVDGWKGSPTSIQAAFSTDRFSFFVDENKLYPVKSTGLTSEEHVGERWLHCGDKSKPWLNLESY